MKMTIDYMVELHNFLYTSNDANFAKLVERVQNHLLYIPRKKLYRYRKPTNREISTLSKNSIWLSDPDSFPDIFDATIPLHDDLAIGNDYAFQFTAEIGYKVLVETAEDGEIIPSKDSFIQALYATKEKYRTLSSLEKRMREIYGSEYEALREMTRATPEHNQLVTNLSNNAIDLLRHIGSSARNMITQDVRSNIGFDFDVNFEVNDPEENYSAEELRHHFQNALNRVVPQYGYSCAEDSTRVLTIKKKNVFLSRIEHSCDFAIVHNYIDEDGIHRQQYVRYNKQARRYVWETQPAGYRQLIEKADWLRHHGYWEEVKSLYLEKKNYNTDPSKRSRALYAETVNEICMRHGFNKQGNP